MLVWGVLSVPISTRSQIKEYEKNIKSGMVIADLIIVAGAPEVILYEGDKLDHAHQMEVPAVEGDEAIYFYPKEGFPYYNLFVSVNEESNVVTGLVIDKMW